MDKDLKESLKELIKTRNNISIKKEEIIKEIEHIKTVVLKLKKCWSPKQKLKITQTKWSNDQNCDSRTE